MSDDPKVRFSVERTNEATYEVHFSQPLRLNPDDVPASFNPENGEYVADPSGTTLGWLIMNCLTSQCTDGKLADLVCDYRSVRFRVCNGATTRHVEEYIVNVLLYNRVSFKLVPLGDELDFSPQPLLVPYNSQVDTADEEAFCGDCHFQRMYFIHPVDGDMVHCARVSDNFARHVVASTAGRPVASFMADESGEITSAEMTELDADMFGFGPRITACIERVSCGGKPEFT